MNRAKKLLSLALKTNAANPVKRGHIQKTCGEPLDEGDDYKELSEGYDEEEYKEELRHLPDLHDYHRVSVTAEPDLSPKEKVYHYLENLRVFQDDYNRLFPDKDPYDFDAEMLCENEGKDFNPQDKPQEIEISNVDNNSDNGYKLSEDENENITIKDSSSESNANVPQKDIESILELQVSEPQLFLPEPEATEPEAPEPEATEPPAPEPEATELLPLEDSPKKKCKERLVICPICFHDVSNHFARHLTRHHKKDSRVKAILKLPSGSKLRGTLIQNLRKQGYFHLKVERDILQPIRQSKKKNAMHVVCPFCVGSYSKHFLYRHVKICIQKPENAEIGKNCLADSQTFEACAQMKNVEFFKKMRLYNEVFRSMQADEISRVAKNDPMIILFGEALINRHKRLRIKTMVSNKMREIARLKIVIQKHFIHDCVTLFHILKPENFQTFVDATRVICGYNNVTKTYRAPSLALHMGTSIKFLCNIAWKMVLEKRKDIPLIKIPTNSESMKRDIKDLRKLVEAHWNNEISSLALKNLKENKWEKPAALPLTSDINMLNEYLKTLSEMAFQGLQENKDVAKNYAILSRCTLLMTIIFNRRRPAEVECLLIEKYKQNYDSVNREEFTLTALEKILTDKFKRVVSGGKGTKPVPLLFSKKIQRYIEILLDIRRSCNLVPTENEFVFANVGSSQRSMNGYSILRKFARKCGAQQPELLTPTRFRKHMATTLQVMHLEEDEIEQVATFMGHTKKTHAEFYRLPQDLFQSAKVVKLLMLLNKGKGIEFKGKSLNQLDNLEENVFELSESESEDPDTADESFREQSTSTAAHALSAVISRTRASKSNDQDTDLDQTEDEESEDDDPAPPFAASHSNERNAVYQPEDEESEIDDPTPTSTVSKSMKRRVGCLKVEKCVKKKKYTVTKPRNKKGEEVDCDAEAPKKCQGRVKWSEQEKAAVLSHFKVHIQKKTLPKKHECEEFKKKYSKVLDSNKEWSKIKTYVYNVYREK